MKVQAIATTVATEVLTRFGPKAAEYLLKRGEQYLEHMSTDADEMHKHCLVCGRRIKAGAKFHATRRFYCGGCGLRTHVGCAADVNGKLCKQCGAEGEN